MSTDSSASRPPEPELVAQALESIGDGFMALDSEWRFVYVNATAERFSNQARSRILGRNYWDIFPEGAGTIIEREYRRAMSERTVGEFETHVERWEKWFRVRCYPTQGGGLSVYFLDITETRTAREENDRLVREIRESEERLSALVSATASIIWTTSADGQFTTPQPSWEAYTGQRWPDYKGTGGMSAIHPEDVPRVSQAWHAAVATAGVYEAEIRLWHGPSRQYRYTVCRGAPMRDAAGSIREWVGAYEDIHEKRSGEERLRQFHAARRESETRELRDRREAEAVLRASEERFRSIVEAAAEGIWIIDKLGITTFANPRMGELLGYKPEEMLGRSCFDFIHPEEKEPSLEVFEKRKAEGDFIPREYRFVRGDGAIRWLSFVGSRMYDVDGEMTGLLAMCMDATERRLADEHILLLNRELGAKVAELETLLDVIPVGIAFSDYADCRVVRLNPAAQRIHGTEKSANPGVIGPDAGSRPYRVMQDGVELRPENFPLRKAASLGEETRDAEFDILRADGKVVQVLCSASPLLDREGNARGSVAALLDISERKIMENALRRANAALEQFAYAAAHDLQEPVRNVVVYTQLLAREYGDKLDSQARDFMRFTTDGARRMQNLIQDLLAYTRATTEDEDPAEAVCDANAVLQEVLGHLRGDIERTRGSVTVDALPMVAVRHGHLVQLGQNLVSNALKYRGPMFPRVHVSAAQQGQEWVFMVKDNGMGIPPEHHKRIFRVFKRLHGREIAGTGIGLAICERIVTYYGGRIWVESEAGRGAAFRFTLPGARKAE